MLDLNDEVLAVAGQWVTKAENDLTAKETLLQPAEQRGKHVRDTMATILAL